MLLDALAALELPGLAIERSAAGNWHAGDGLADSRVDALIANWRQLPAGRVEAYRGSATPRGKIRARLDGGREIEFFLLSIEPEVVIANPALGLQYRFGGDRYYGILALASDESSG